MKLVPYSKLRLMIRIGILKCEAYEIDYFRFKFKIVLELGSVL